MLSTIETVKKTSFKDIVVSVLKSIFSIETDCDRIYIDINSCMSILFRADNVDSKFVNEKMMEIIEEFITKYLAKNTELIFMFTVKPSKLHCDIYPDWCKNRYERVKIDKNQYLRTLLATLNHFSSKNPLVKVINTDDIHPVFLVRLIEIGNRRHRAVVLSKDTVFQCINLSNIIVFTGPEYIDFSDKWRHLPDNITLEDSEYYLPYYLAIKGDKRNEFSGVKGYGRERALKYVNVNKINIYAKIDHELKEHCDKYAPLYDVSSMAKQIDVSRIKSMIKKK